MLPSGQYFAIIGNMRPGRGGMTRLMLMRQRLFYEAGIPMPVLTFDIFGNYPAVRTQLIADGFFHPDAELLNVWDSYLDLDVSSFPVINKESAIDISKFQSENNFRDEILWSITYRDVQGTEVVRDFHRQDGSLGIRYFMGERDQGDIKIEVFNGDGSVVLTFDSTRAMNRHWLESLVSGDNHVFLISDTRRMIVDFLDMDERFFTFVQLHNPHTLDNRHFLARVKKNYKPVMEYKDKLDALSVLTERQKNDISKRYGTANNLYVIANPVSSPTKLPATHRRSNRLVVTISRLQGQKRIDRAIRAFAILLKEIPDAQFHIYGSGKLFDEMQSLIDELGINHAVKLCGYDPHAHEVLTKATCYWSTSEFEGYPLGTLEAMSQGCPVIAYDVKYGLREQIKDGYNGFLIEPDDIQTLVSRTISLMNEPELLSRLSEGAIIVSGLHSTEKFLSDTASVLNAMVAKRSARTKVTDRKIESIDLRFAQLGGFKRFTKNMSINMTMTMHIQSHAVDSTLSSEHFFLDLVSPQSDNIVQLPLSVDIVNSEFILSTYVDRQRVKEAISSLGENIETVQLRLGYAWGNSTWVHPLTKRLRVLTRNGDPWGFATQHILPRRH